MPALLKTKPDLMTKVVGVLIDGAVSWLVKSVGISDYDTACGIDAFAQSIGGQGTVDPTRGQKIDCDQCKMLWQGFKELKLKASDFAD